jgi:hypothetical protein
MTRDLIGIDLTVDFIKVSFLFSFELGIQLRSQASRLVCSDKSEEHDYQMHLAGKE